MDKKIYVILGAPGSGKGTRSELISEKLGIPHISTGSLIRQNSKIISMYNDSVSVGKLIPDSVIENLLIRELNKENTFNGYILDGYPRNIEQARRLDEILLERNEKITKVFLLDVTIDVIYSRIHSRKICSRCAKTYGAKDKTNKGDRCHICGGEIVLRIDDNDETLKNRIDIFFKEAKDIQKHYEDRGLLEIINSNEEIDEMLKRI